MGSTPSMTFTMLTQYYPPEVGAPQARLSELAAHFVARGHSVRVLTAMPNYPTGVVQDGYGGLLRRESRDGAEVIRTFIYPTQRPDRVRRLTNYMSFVASSSLAGSFLLGRSNYLLVESPPLFLGLAGVWLSRLTGAKLIFNVSDLWPESAVRLGVLGAGGAAYKLSAALERWCYERAWLVTGQSRSIVDDIRRRFPRVRTLRLSNGVDTHRFRPEAATGADRAGLGAPGECVALYAGLHGLAQGLDIVLDAARALQAEGGVRFVLVGDGPEKRGLTERAREMGLTNVTFLDPRPASEMPALVAAADVVLVTLKSHIPGAVPSKLYEAMASGRPVVLVADGEARDIVSENDTGIAVEFGDVDGLARALGRLRDSPQLRRRLGESGRRVAEQQFDRAAIASRFIEQLEGAL